MAKQKTKGDPIQIRLPLDVDASVRARATKHGVAPAVIVSGIVQNAYRKVAPIDTARANHPAAIDIANPADPARLHDVVVTDDNNCKHPKSMIRVTSSAGLHRCECGATRGVDGTWR
jgi:hypothetical protein